MKKHTLNSVNLWRKVTIWLPIYWPLFTGLNAFVFKSNLEGPLSQIVYTSVIQYSVMQGSYLHTSVILVSYLHTSFILMKFFAALDHLNKYNFRYYVFDSFRVIIDKCSVVMINDMERVVFTIRLP